MPVGVRVASTARGLARAKSRARSRSMTPVWLRHHGGMEHGDVTRWVNDYEVAWRSAGTDQLADLFAEEATYLVSPWAEPIRGLAAIREFWESGRDGPDEVFTMTSEVVAVDDRAAVVRAEVT